ncbi:ribonuclease 3 [Fusarium tjaetaba]|uniref:Ribonuclease 3 n=1 Tax=Fusarium tjaetaba TaxID=1567544 RepID=A0A8H5QNQ0_9HYPO|nr:ribonuclease 3 [Fusarium tjaetaba]KAF5618074.1 ribonuclease 3 [Fusarium tjaetaba]
MTSCLNFSQKVSECESIIAYEFSSKTLCAEALNRAADWNCLILIDGSTKWMPKNDRLAVYGDSAAAFHLCNLWIKRGLSNHCWTTIRGDLISNSNLARIGKERGLDKCINMNGGSRPPSPAMVATAVEAILGAVQIDGGHEALARVINHLGLTQHALLASVVFNPPFAYD